MTKRTHYEHIKKLISNAPYIAVIVIKLTLLTIKSIFVQFLASSEKILVYVHINIFFLYCNHRGDGYFTFKRNSSR